MARPSYSSCEGRFPRVKEEKLCCDAIHCYPSHWPACSSYRKAFSAKRLKLRLRLKHNNLAKRPPAHIVRARPTRKRALRPKPIVPKPRRRLLRALPEPTLAITPTATERLCGLQRNRPPCPRQRPHNAATGAIVLVSTAKGRVHITAVWQSG